MSDVVAAAREALGPVGAFLPNMGVAQLPPIEFQREAVRRIERAGYRSAWTNEGVGGRDALVHAGILLAASERLAFGTAITSMWARAPQHLHAGATQLAEAYPNRFVLGVGAGYAFQAEQVGRTYHPPLTQFAEYLAQMPSTPPIVQPPVAPYARIIAANRQRMLALARDAADGAHPTLVPSSYVENARATLGPDKLLVVGLSVVPDDDRDAARAQASAILVGALGFPGSPYRANLEQLGYSQEELDTGAQRLVDDLVGYGSPADIAAQVQRHLDAGADHVIVTTLGGDFVAGVDLLERVAPAVTELTGRS